jgi:peptidoglycan hydrolase CwlO-like protein
VSSWLQLLAQAKAADGGGNSVFDLILVALASGGLIGALVAWRKVPSDQATAAVTQSGDTLQQMRDLNDELKEELERVRAERQTAITERNNARDRARTAEAQLTGLEAQVRVLEQRLQRQQPPPAE